MIKASAALFQYQIAALYRSVSHACVLFLSLFSRLSVRGLQRLHATRLRVSFGDDIIAEQEASIEALTQEITSVSEKGRIARDGNAGNHD